MHEVKTELRARPAADSGEQSTKAPGSGRGLIMQTVGDTGGTVVHPHSFCNLSSGENRNYRFCCPADVRD